MESSYKDMQIDKVRFYVCVCVCVCVRSECYMNKHQTITTHCLLFLNPIFSEALLVIKIKYLDHNL